MHTVHIPKTDIRYMRDMTLGVYATIAKVKATCTRKSHFLFHSNLSLAFVDQQSKTPYFSQKDLQCFIPFESLTSTKEGKL